MKILIKAGDSAEVEGSVPKVGELLLDSEQRRLVTGDDATPGGIRLTHYGTITTPTVASPLDGAAISLNLLNITTSIFSGNGVHYATQYQVATDLGFTNVVYDAYSKVDLVSHVVSPDITGMQTNDPLYFRVRHVSTVAGFSQWSPVVAVTVA